MLTYLDGPRFVVRELEGYAEIGVGSRAALGLCITVIDRAYCSQVVRKWLTSDHNPGGSGPNAWTRDSIRAKIRAEAEADCAERNARVAGVQAGTSLGTDHPSLSPFDSGCPR